MITTFKQFKLKQHAKRNCVYLHVDFEGGDADTNHPESYLIKGVTMDNIDEHLEEINHMIDNFKKLKKVLDDSDNSYEQVVEEYGEEIARLYDNTPNDPQSDYSYKCYISSIELHAYDENGDLYTQYIR
jgi:hypothetical protein